MMSKEHKRKIGESNKGKLKGRIPWNKGMKVDRYKFPKMGHFLKHSEKTKLKISKKKIGKKMSKETKLKMSNNPYRQEIGYRNKMSKIKTGHKTSKETRLKIGIRNLGKHHSEKAKKIMSELRRGKKRTKESRKKQGLSTRGKKSCHWKGGITPENKKIRNSIEYRLWRESVFARDNWTCQKSNIKGGVLNAHHIKNFAQYPELRFAIDNGITFSKKEHNKFHKKYGKKNNNQEQINKFNKI